MGPRRRRFVEMERLRIEFARERLDLVGGEGVAADLDAGADDEILEEIHAPSLRRRAARTSASRSCASPASPTG